MDAKLSYPIGKYTPPSIIDDQQIKTWIEEIERLPIQMREAVKGLTDDQLDTPYRPAGWTVRQVVNHVPDSHLNCYVRFHWTLTEHSPKIKAYDEKAWANLPYHQSMPIETSLDLLMTIHRRWAYLLKSLRKEDLKKDFIHPEDGHSYTLEVTIGNYAWHGKHHLAHILNLKKRMDW